MPTKASCPVLLYPHLVALGNLQGCVLLLPSRPRKKTRRRRPMNLGLAETYCEPRWFLNAAKPTRNNGSNCRHAQSCAVAPKQFMCVYIYIYICPTNVKTFLDGPCRKSKRSFVHVLLATHVAKNAVGEDLGTFRCGDVNIPLPKLANLVTACKI